MFHRAIQNFRPRPRIRTLDWAREYVQTHEGRPYDHSAYPHLGNCGGPMDAMDCPQIMTIVLQFASRLGKTFYGTTAQMKAADTDPCPMMFASSDQKLATEVVDRMYRMLEKCPRLRDQLRPKHRRRQNLVDLANCRNYVAWARSVSTLADKAVKIGHANEVDKWEHLKTSKEADPLELFLDRFKEFPSHKKIIESTPALKHQSRVERARLGSFNASYFVPCPHCGRYQPLKMDQLKWDKNEVGKSDKDIARATARYECLYCPAPIRDEHRAPMMRAGVWVPEGCGVNNDAARESARAWKEPGQPMWRGWKESPWITGTPARDGRDAGYQLSSLYALSLSWGDIAAKFVDCQAKPQNLRNFVNQWLGETWEIVSRKATWEQVGKRLINDDLERFVVPLWATMLTLGVDRQSKDGDRYPWTLVAWGPDRRCAVIAYGESSSLEAIDAELLQRTYSHADGGERVKIAFTLVDSGHRPDGIYEFCLGSYRRGLQVWPCKGSSQALESDYRQSTLGDNTSCPGMVLFHVDTIRSQLWVDKVVHDLKHDDPGGGCIHKGSLAEHQDFLEQVINDAAIEALDSHNNSRESWDRINTNIPNDFRDTLRYAYVAMLISTRGAQIQPRVKKEIVKRSAVISAGMARPDGRSWM